MTVTQLAFLWGIIFWAKDGARGGGGGGGEARRRLRGMSRGIVKEARQPSARPAMIGACEAWYANVPAPATRYKNAKPQAAWFGLFLHKD